MAPPPVSFPGFSAISDRVYLRDGHEKAKPAPPNEPTTIVIFGWGDGLPKYVSKYSDGYHELYPSARIVVVLSKTFHASNQPEEQRIEAMMPVVDTVFPTPTGSGADERVLLHCMSNTGGIFLAATFAAYQRRHGTDKKLPHQLLVCDSTPGSLDFSSQVGRWSRAMAVGTAKHFPGHFSSPMASAEPSGHWAMRIMNDKSVVPVEPPRLYLYSKEDEIIWWEDLEEIVAQVKMEGFQVDMEMFEGSSHVGHMRLHPEQYWNKIFGSWKAAIGE
ncbi:hypothetical protein N7470_008071 [Penicillium chermesinum]|nr:hypothetical protein N7470_008071 [Penicillium chermesinum]